MSKQNVTLNNTLEEELRLMLVEKNNECAALRAENKLLKQNIASEQEQKYNAYKRLADKVS
tara:strand:+ start:6781 stop:6963 length:183 start_codon:yes stop_codon:yes gene_type:complete